ncbi:MAG: hypothetical protein LIO96_07920 [Lachnospiraceae bacterium]|nr:hypothetical protein [Lachnospiraceae bacterium]
MNPYEKYVKSTYKKIPKEVKTFIEGLIGKEETRRLITNMRERRIIVLTGPMTSGKTTIKVILKALGYPFVVEDGEDAWIIHTSDTVPVQYTYDEVLEQLGIETKC